MTRPWGRGASAARASGAPPLDAGSATPVAVALVAVMVVVALAIAQAGALLSAHARADGAADVAALAAARSDRNERALGASSVAALRVGCRAAHDLASVNGARVTSCARGAAWSIQVRVAVEVRSWPVPVESVARAGPVIPLG